MAIEEKIATKTVGFVAPAYAMLIPLAQRIARPFGYAIAVHGSMNRDLDLVAIPWVDDAVEAEVLVEEMVKKFSPFLDYEGFKMPTPTVKPHGRRSWSIVMHAGCYIDISVMPRLRDVN